MSRTAVIERVSDVAPVRAMAAGHRDLIWVSPDERVTEAMRRAGLACRWLGEGFSDQDASSVEEEAWRLARTWHSHPDVRPLVEYDGRNVGALTELYIGLHLVWVLKNLRYAQRHLDSHRPSEVLSFDTPAVPMRSFFPGPGEPMAAAAFGALGARLGSLGRSAPPAKAMKLYDWKSAARHPLGAMYRLFVRPSHARREAPVLFVSAPKHVEAVVAGLGLPAAYLDEGFRWAKLPFLRAHGIPYLSYPELRRAIPKEGRVRLVAYLRELPAPNTAIGRLADAGVFKAGAGDLTRLLRPRLEYFFGEWLPRTAEMIEAFRAFCARQRFKVAVVDEDTVTFRKALVGEARRAGIRTVQVPHGVNFSDFQYDLFPVSSDAVAVGGRDIGTYYEAKGVRARIRATGIPRYDKISTASSAGVRSRLNIEGKKLVVYWGTTLFPALETRRDRFAQRKAIEDAIDAVKGRPDCVMIVKKHPLDSDPEWTEGVIAAAGVSNVRVLSDETSESLLAVCDLSISFQSNVLIESLVLGKPSIILDYFPRSHNHVPVLAREGARLAAHDAASLRELVGRSLDRDPELMAVVDRVRAALVPDWVGPLDGRSGERVAELIRQEAV